MQPLTHTEFVIRLGGACNSHSWHHFFSPIISSKGHKWNVSSRLVLHSELLQESYVHMHIFVSVCVCLTKSQKKALRLGKAGVTLSVPPHPWPLVCCVYDSFQESGLKPVYEMCSALGMAVNGELQNPFSRLIQISLQTDTGCHCSAPLNVALQKTISSKRIGTDVTV